MHFRSRPCPKSIPEATTEENTEWPSKKIAERAGMV